MRKKRRYYFDNTDIDARLEKYSKISPVGEEDLEMKRWLEKTHK